MASIFPIVVLAGACLLSGANDPGAVTVDGNGNVHMKRESVVQPGQSPIADASKSVFAGRSLLKPVTYEHVEYELFLPKNWASPHPQKAGQQSFPVLVFLHGRGESGGFEVTNAQSLPLQLLSNSSFAESCPFIVVIPQCPWRCATANHWLPAYSELA